MLKHRGVKRHKILENNSIQRQSVSGGGSSIFDVEQEVARKAEWERLLTRGKDQVARERAALDEHLRVEA